MNELKQKVIKYIKSETCHPDEMLKTMREADYKKMANTLSFQLWNMMDEFKNMKSEIKKVW